jgi:trimeric autotransporter adhesin
MRGVVVDSLGNVYIADRDNRRVRKLATNGVITTIAGTGVRGFSGDGGPATSAQLDTPWDLALDSGGNLYIADVGVYRVRKVTTGGTISTVAGNGNSGHSGDGGAATSAGLNPSGIALDAAGNLYISSFHRVRKVTGGTITTIVGTGQSGFGGDTGPATAAQLGGPEGLAVDGAGNLFIADRGNRRIRKVTPGGTISTVAGFCCGPYTGDGGPATTADLGSPSAVAVDSSGNMYIADEQRHRVRVVGIDGIIQTAAGVGVAGFGGDMGPPAFANLNVPSAVAVDAYGNLFISDLVNLRVRKVTFLPAVSSASGTGSPGTSFTITLTGTRLMNLINAVFSGAGITASIQSGGTATGVTLLVTAAPDAASGPRTLTLTRSDGTSTALTVDTGSRRTRGQITSQ